MLRVPQSMLVHLTLMTTKATLLGQSPLCRSLSNHPQSKSHKLYVKVTAGHRHFMKKQSENIVFNKEILKGKNLKILLLKRKQ